MPRSASASAEGVVLLAGALDPEHVVEQQVVLVARCEPLQLEARAGARSTVRSTPTSEWTPSWGALDAPPMVWTAGVAVVSMLVIVRLQPASAPVRPTPLDVIASGAAGMVGRWPRTAAT